MFGTVLGQLVIGVVALVIIALIVNALRPKKEKEIHDHRQHLEPNDTNYNIGHVLSPEAIQKASPAEAREIIQKYERGDLASLSDDDFFLLKKKVDQAERA